MANLSMKAILEQVAFLGAQLQGWQGPEHERVAAAKCYSLMGQAWNELHIATLESDNQRKG